MNRYRVGAIRITLEHNLQKHIQLTGAFPVKTLFHVIQSLLIAAERQSRVPYHASEHIYGVVANHDILGYETSDNIRSEFK